MEKSNIITRIIKKFLSGRFSVETEEKVQRWIMKEENAEEKEKASLEYWNELDTETCKNDGENPDGKFNPGFPCCQPRD